MPPKDMGGQFKNSHGLEQPYNGYHDHFEDASEKYKWGISRHSNAMQRVSNTREILQVIPELPQRFQEKIKNAPRIQKRP